MKIKLAALYAMIIALASPAMAFSGGWPESKRGILYNSHNETWLHIALLSFMLTALSATLHRYYPRNKWLYAISAVGVLIAINLILRDFYNERKSWASDMAKFRCAWALACVAVSALAFSFAKYQKEQLRSKRRDPLIWTCIITAFSLYYVALFKVDFPPHLNRHDFTSLTGYMVRRQ